MGRVVSCVHLYFRRYRPCYSLGCSTPDPCGVILHGVQGWYPMLPILRRLGVRSQNEIEEERNTLRILRGDHEAYRTTTYH